MNFDNSMPYTISESGTAANNSEYLLKIRDFLVNIAGFTEHDSGSGYYILLKDSIYYAFFLENGNYPSVKFYTSETAPATIQLGSSISCVIPMPNTAIENYHLYYNGRNVLIVTEYDIGFYSFASGGTSTVIGFNDLGTYHTSTLMAATSSSNPTIISNYKAFTTNDLTVLRLNGNECRGFNDLIELGVYERDFVYNSKIKLNEKGLLFNNLLTVENKIPVFEFSDLFLSGVEYYATEEQFSIGSKVFKFFPNYQKYAVRDYDTLTKAMGLCVRIS